MMSENQLEQELKPAVGFTDEANTGTDPRYAQAKTVNVNPDNQTKQPVIGTETTESGQTVETTQDPETVEAGEGQGLTEGSADEVLKRVGNDPAKAKAALAEEKKGEKRKGLTADLQKIVDDAEAGDQK